MDYTFNTHTPSPSIPAEIRNDFRSMSNADFSERYNISIPSLKAWARVNNLKKSKAYRRAFLRRNASRTHRTLCASDGTYKHRVARWQLANINITDKPKYRLEAQCGEYFRPTAVTYSVPDCPRCEAGQRRKSRSIARETFAGN